MSNDFHDMQPVSVPRTGNTEKPPERLPGRSELGSAIPDLRGLSLEQVAALDDTVLTGVIALYRERMAGNSAPLNSFQARI